ncbi:MAG: PAS domain S-box protein [Candidatus Gracilibacteria bacterium]|jgi:PAS domain S-box-containing protein
MNNLKLPSTPANSTFDNDKYLENIVKTINIAKAMNECLWVGDKDHKTIYVNPEFEKISEFSLEECIGRNCVSFFDEETKKTIENNHRLRTKGLSSQYEGTLLSKSGKRISLLISGAPLDTGGTIGVFTNLTVLKDLTKKDAMSQQIIKNSAEAIVILNKTEKVQLWNAGAEKMFGYTEAEIINKPVAIIVPPTLKSASEEIIKDVNSKKFIKNIETQRQTKTGELLDVSISITKVVDKNNKFIGYLVIYRDVSHQKKVNIELQKRFETIQDAYKELGIQKRQMDYVYEITNAATSSSTSISSLSNLIISAMAILTKSDGVVLRLYDPIFDSLKLASCLGVSQKWLSKNKIQLKGSLADDAIKNKRPLLIDNVQSSFKHKGIKLVKAHKFSTLILIPLILPNKIIGTISLYSIDPAKFRFIETDFLENFSKQCSLALHIKTLEKSMAQA